MTDWIDSQRRNMVDALMNQTLIQRPPGNEATARAYLGDRSTMNLVTPLAQDDSMSPMNMAMGLIGGPSLRGAMAGVAGGIRAFHGSPHKFDKFDMSRIGTGEGAQAYGHGLYFAEREGTARAYRDRLSGDIVYQRGGEPVRHSDMWLQVRDAAQAVPKTHPDQAGEVAHQILSLIENNKKSAGWVSKNYAPPEGFERQWDAALRALEGVKYNPHKGHMYEVNIRANPEQFLDWDRKVRDMPPAVQGKLSGLGFNTSGPEQGLIGSQIVNRGIDAGGGAEAARVFREAGIPGIKYLDQGSRSAGQGSSNYVVFDDSIIDILKRYGLMGAAAIPAGALGIPAADPPVFAQ